MNKYLVVLLALVGLIPANAQYTFTIDGGFSGDCARVIGVRELNTQLQQLKGQAISGFPDQSSCEQVRNLVNSVKAQAEMIIYDARTGRTIDRKKYNCYFKLTASPCTGRPMNRSTINIGVPNIKGVNQGTSFYSTNGAQEINDWSNNYMEQILALKKNAQKQMTTTVSTGDDEYDRARNSSLPVIDPDKPFLSVNLRDENGNMAEPNELYFGEVMRPNDERYNYFLEKEFTDEFYLEYYKTTKINIYEILNKSEKSGSDLELIKAYQKWLKQKTDKISMFKDMAICSAVEYSDGNKELMNSTKYQFITEAPDYEVNRLLKLVELCNNEPLNQGFHADVFYNEETKEYAISFRGTEFPSENEFILEAFSKFDIISFAKESIGGIFNDPSNPTKNKINAITAALDNLITDLVEGNTDRIPASFHDLSTDASQAIGKVLTQYKMAIEIGEAIKSIVEENPNIKINITGHSMGGGEGIIAGLVSGQPTFVFNPAGVHEATYEFADVTKKVESGDYDIYKIITPDDPLTNFQESKKDNWSTFRNMAKDIVAKKGANPNTSVPKAIGKEYVLKTNQGHSIEPIANILIRQKNTLDILMKGDIRNSINVYIE